MRAHERLKKLVLLSPAGSLVPLKKQFYLRGTLSAALPGLSRLLTKPLWFNWFFYRPNLEDGATRVLFERVSSQLALGLQYFRMAPTVLPFVYQDNELRAVSTPTLLLIGRQEALYDPTAAVTRAKRLMPDIQTELISHASHDLPLSLPAAVNQRILAFIAAARGFETERARRLQPA